MHTKYFLLQAFILTTGLSLAQKKLPVIKANSKEVVINDAGYFDKNAWYLSPEAKPDIYVAARASKSKFVTFYTDIDSISVKLKPGSKFDFVILLNGKDSCYTRIVSSSSIKNSIQQSRGKIDTIPFKLTNYNAIHIKTIINNSDTLNMHFDVGTLGFRLTKNALSRFNEKTIQKITMDSLAWDNPNLLTANNVAHEMDGRFGWQAFDGKIVEINYDKSIIIVYSKLPLHAKQYAKSNIHFIQSLFCVQASIQLAGKNYTGDFLFDSGSDLAMILDSTWMSLNQFPDDQKIIRKSSLSDGGGRKYETTIVLMPRVNVNGFVVENIPTSKLGFKSPVGYQINYFGNEFLKRFNTIIDLKNDCVYLKPNHLYNIAFKEIDQPKNE